MPLFDVRSALQGPAMDPEAKRRKQLKRQIAEFIVNPYSVSDDPRAYYTQLKALATQEGIPMNMPKSLERNLLGVGMYDAADTALFGMLPNQELLNEKERMAAGVGSVVGMAAAIPTGMAAVKGLGKLAPGLSKLMPKSMQKMFKANKKFSTPKGKEMKERVNDFEKFLRGKGLDPKNFTGAEGLEREAIREFLKAKKTSKSKDGWASFRKTFLDALHADKRFKYKKGKGANLSKLREDLGGAASTGKTGYYNMKDNQGFKDALDDLSITMPKTAAESTANTQKLSDWIMKNGPHNMKVDFWQAKQGNDKAKMKQIINKVLGMKAWKMNNYKGSLAQSSKKLGVVADDMSAIALGDDISLMDFASPLDNLPGMNPIQAARRNRLDDIMGGAFDPTQSAVGRGLPSGMSGQGAGAPRGRMQTPNPYGQTPNPFSQAQANPAQFRTQSQQLIDNAPTLPNIGSPGRMRVPNPYEV